MIDPVAVEDPWQVLGVTPQTPAPEIAAAYRRAVKLTHPDRGGTATDFTRVRNAWEQLQQPAPQHGWTETVDDPADAEHGPTPDHKGPPNDEATQAPEHQNTDEQQPVAPTRRRPRRSRPGAVLVAALLLGLVVPPGEPPWITDPVQVVASVAWLGGLAAGVWVLVRGSTVAWVFATVVLAITGWQLGDTPVDRILVIVVVLGVAVGGHGWRIRASRRH